MKFRRRKLLKEKKGLSLIEAAMAASALSALALFMFKIQEGSVKYNANLNSDAKRLELTRLVQLNFSDKDNCSFNFSVGSVPALKYTTKLLAKDGTAVIDTNFNDIYSKDGIILKSIKFVQKTFSNEVILLEFERLKIGDQAAISLTNEVPLNIELDSQNNFLSCFSEKSNSARTTVREIIRKACVNPGFIYDESSDPDDPKCTASTSVLKECPQGELLKKISIGQAANGTLSYDFACSSLTDVNGHACAPNDNVIIEGANIVCYPQCPIGQIGLYHHSSGFLCIDLVCQADSTTTYYLAGINTNGSRPVKDCKPLIHVNQSICQTGFQLMADIQTGSLKVVCNN